MLNPRLAFLLFAAAILFSMVREWGDSRSCPRFQANRANVFLR